MKSSNLVLCQKRCTLTEFSCSYFDIGASLLDETQCTSEDDDDQSSESTSNSITHWVHSDSPDHIREEVTREAHGKSIRRISTRQQCSRWHRWSLSRWALVILLNLLLLVANDRARSAVASHSSSSPSHQNHSNHVALPSNSLPPPTESLVSSLLSSPASSSLLPLSSSTLLLEELLQEQSLEDAISKLTDAWKQAHGDSPKSRKERRQEQLPSNDLLSDQMISSNQVKLVKLYQLTSDTEIHQRKEETAQDKRTRRWTKSQGTVNSKRSRFGEENATPVPNESQRRLNRSRRDQRQQSLQGQPALPVTSNCTRCRQKEEARSLRIEAIKYNILNKLGLERAPNVSTKSLPEIPPLSDLLLEQYRNGDVPRTIKIGNSHQKRFAGDHFGPLQSHPDPYGDEFFVNAQKSYVFAQSPPPERIVVKRHRAQYFKFPASIVNKHLQHATLWIFLNGSKPHSVASEGHIHIYKVVRGEPSLVTTTVPSTRLPNSLLLKSDWIKVDITSLVSEWFRKPDDNLGLVVHSHESLHGTELPVVVHHDGASSKKPFIEVVVSSHPRESSRRKRMAPEFCDDKSSELRCCRYPLTIDFESFGWEWIIAPKRYEANYCSGECGFIFMNGYPHTHLIQQTNVYNPTGPCCSPRKMSPISMLYMDSDFNIIYGILPNMVVDKCDCS